MSASDTGTLKPEDIFEILSNKRRRMVLYYLRQQGDSVGVKELAEQIAAMENDIPVEELTSQQRKRVYVSLYQTHLPKMARTNVIDYDKEAGTVHLTDQSNNMDRYLTNDHQSTYAWRSHYVGLTVVGVAALVLSLIGAPGFAALPILSIVVVLLGTYVLSIVVQYWLMQRQSEKIPLELYPDD